MSGEALPLLKEMRVRDVTRFHKTLQEDSIELGDQSLQQEIPVPSGIAGEWTSGRRFMRCKVDT